MQDPATLSVIISAVIARWRALYPGEEVDPPMLRRLAFAAVRETLAGAPPRQPAAQAVGKRQLVQ